MHDLDTPWSQNLHCQFTQLVETGFGVWAGRQPLAVYIYGTAAARVKEVNDEASLNKQTLVTCICT